MAAQKPHVEIFRTAALNEELGREQVADADALSHLKQA
jgi:hypothetical protein